MGMLGHIRMSHVVAGISDPNRPDALPNFQSRSRIIGGSVVAYIEFASPSCPRAAQPAPRGLVSLGP